VPTGTVVRFDRRRGYGFIQPDDAGEDVFVHQNNINMEGFRFLQVGEKVSFELELGEKGSKAVSVALTEPRKERPEGAFDGGAPAGFGGDRPSFGGDRGDRGAYGDRAPRAPRPAGGGGDDRTKRKLERLISLLVEKGVLAPGDVDALDAAAPRPAAPAAAPQA